MTGTMSDPLPDEPSSAVSSGPASWAWWPEGREVVRVARELELWGQRVVEILVPSTAALHRVPADALRDPAVRQWSPEEIAWRAAAARALHLMAQRGAVSLAGRDLEPLPHQLSVLDRALGMDPVRLLLADEVGLGKTIEAGLIYTELKARGRAERVLVVAPKGVQLQWVAEMRQRFGEEFALVGPGGVPVDAGVDPWRAFDRVVCSLDAVKPLRRRAGWSPERVEEHNRRRFRAVVEAGWDLVVFDEAHHVAGSDGGVARHALARELARRAPHVLLLSATPHSGKTEGFARLLGLLEPAFLQGRPIDREHVAPLVVRTEKRQAVNASGRPLFQPRTTSLEVVPYGERNLERKLYEAVTDYVRHGYDRARRERRPALGFLVLLMQRLVSSSTAAILTALERRAAALAEVGAQLRLFAERAEEWGELTGEEQLEALLAAQGAAWGDERAEVEILLDLARKASATGVDAKARYLLELLRRIQREEGDPAVKVVVFTEFVPTQEMLLGLLEQVGIRATAINGSMSMEERALAQEAFREQAQVLVSTDAGGEGINLQFAHVVVNYDLPWNPMRIEQRIGRVDRIGQRWPVRAYNLVLENSVDQHVLRVLEEKLWRILEELGTDKWSDVLESASRGVEDLYAEAIADPQRLESDAAALADRTREEVRRAEALRSMLAAPTAAARNRRAAEAADWLSSAAEAYERWSGERLARPSDVLGRLREAASSEPVPQVRGGAAGLWSLWEVRPHGTEGVRDCFALFVTDQGALRPDLAERLWVELTRGPRTEVGPPLAPEAWARLMHMGADHAYAACARLAPADTWRAPWLTLRLVVRSIP
jgi:superfamily II DNA or RNA helicase